MPFCLILSLPYSCRADILNTADFCTAIHRRLTQRLKRWSRIIRFWLMINVHRTWCRSYLPFLYLFLPNGEVTKKCTIIVLSNFVRKQKTQKFEDRSCCYAINSSVQQLTHRLLELYPALPQAAILCHVCHLCRGVWDILCDLRLLREGKWIKPVIPQSWFFFLPWSLISHNCLTHT